MKKFQAYAQGHFSVVRDTPKAAATAFFEEFPKKRKCDVIQGEYDGRLFTIEYSPAKKPISFSGVTKKAAIDLPDTRDGK